MPLNDAHFGEPFFTMIYDKPPYSINKQILKLKHKGLLFDDLKRAKKQLQNINFYRLSAYFYPFYKKHTKTFLDNTTFEKILDLYAFDQSLRQILFHCLGQIEIAIRARLVHKYSMNKGAHWHLKSNLFKNYSDFSLFQKSLHDIMKENKNKVAFIQHYVKRYSEPQYPANWMIIELLTFGQVSRLYKSLRNDKVKKSIATDFGLTELVFESWLHSCNYMRNICAHHHRLWNKKLRITPKNPKRLGFHFLSDTTSVSHDKLYFSISIILYLLNVIQPINNSKTELLQLIHSANVRIKEQMGFPQKYKSEMIWSE